MLVRHIGDRGTIVTFDENISLYLITGTRFHLLCDTHLGPDSMTEVEKYLKDDVRPDRMVIFNSHADWDHIWGNCAFPDSFIIAHETCRVRMQERGAFDLRENIAQVRGAVTIRLPSLTFADRLVLEDEDIEFSYTPGHTIDSAVCYDRKDKILYIGDLAEDPIPYLDAADLDQYLTTLQDLLDHEAEILVSAHSGIVSRDLIRKNMAYIMQVRDGILSDPAMFGDYAPVHQWNLNMRIIHEFEPRIREISGSDHTMISILSHLGDLHSLHDNEVRTVLTRISSRS